jgi:hypothetical protein
MVVTAVIPGTWKANIGRIEVQDYCKNVGETLILINKQGWS